MQHLIATVEPNLRTWLFGMFDTLPHVQLTRLVVTMCAIWTARRKAIHEGIFQSPISTHKFVSCYILELVGLRNHQGARPAVSAGPMVVDTVWKFPPNVL